MVLLLGRKAKGLPLCLKGKHLLSLFVPLGIAGQCIVIDALHDFANGDLFYDFSTSLVNVGEAHNLFSVGAKSTSLYEQLLNNYNISYEYGVVTVRKRNVVLVSGSATKVYDGQPLTNDEVSVLGYGFASGDAADYTVTGTITNAGTVKNTFTYELAENVNPSNYDINTVFGDLTVDVNTNVVVTIQEHGEEHTFNGMTFVVNGYDVEINDPIYTNSDFRFLGKAEVTGSDIGTYQMDLQPSDFANVNRNFDKIHPDSYPNTCLKSFSFLR